MGDRGDPVYGSVVNDGVLFSGLVAAVIAGWRAPLAKRGDGILQALRWTTANVIPERRQRITSDSRSVRTWRSWRGAAVDDEFAAWKRLWTALAHDAGDEPWAPSPAAIELQRAILSGERPHGAWATLEFALLALRQANSEPSPGSHCYLDFIEAHTALERTLLERGRHTDDRDDLEREACAWLCHSPGLRQEDPAHSAVGVARLLYWLALVDLGLRVTEPEVVASTDEGGTPSRVASYLPGTEGGAYVGGVQRWLRCMQRQVAETAGTPVDGARDSRQTMCRTIERLVSEQAAAHSPRGATPADIPPRYRAGAIDERLGRYISGETHFGVHEAHELFGGGGPPLTLQTLGCALIGQLDDLARLLEKRTAATFDDVVAAYARYPVTNACVTRRYEAFRSDGLLRCEAVAHVSPSPPEP